MKSFNDKTVYLIKEREISEISLKDYLEEYVNKEIMTYQGLNKQYSYEGNWEGNLWSVNKWSYSRLEDYPIMFYNKECAEFYLQQGYR